MKNTRRLRAHPLAVLALLALAALVLALSVGSIVVSPADIIVALFGSEGGTGATVVRELRLARALACFACGGLLALAGTLMQVLLRNPLADPYILGVSGGAAVGALAAIVLGLASPWMEAGALAGALAAMLTVFGLAHGDGSWTQTRLLLTGVIVAAGCGAAITLMLALAPAAQVQSMLFWLMGDASGANNPWPALAVLAVGLAAALPFGRDLNVLARGQLSARALGVDTRRLRRGLYVLASLFTAVAVTLLGTVGFVGLVVPHLVRLVLGNDQRILMPAAVLAGGALLSIADTLARTVLAPRQLPVGVLTVLIGVPVFLFLLARQARAGER
ncbi:MAG: iron ABC transporter permease [Azoarcus sp.]|jgi:iron complex transport system permease protein|nr:iron ABC transporter permease [Azoarcus sp.]